MPRKRTARNWVKLDCQGVLDGSINYLFSDLEVESVAPDDVVDLACQAVWLKMIPFCEICGGRSGFIEDNNEKGLPMKYIAQELHCPVDLLNQVIKIMVEDEALVIHPSGSIELVNFPLYQFSEYDRQKKYRNKNNNNNNHNDDPDKFIHGKYGHVVKR